jgi:ribosomal protein S18 acetylase RimI-like enzyme
MNMRYTQLPLINPPSPLIIKVITMEYKKLHVASDAILVSLNALIPQLSSSAKPLTLEALQSMISSTSVEILVALEDDVCVGCLTVMVARIPTGIRCWIEDVVVDACARGKGVGEGLSLLAIEVATELGAKTIDLTSRPDRVAANNLYKKIGFAIRQTNVYRFEVAPK